MKKDLFNFFFILGILIRLTALFFIVPQPVEKWYAPFTADTLMSFDPWASWAAQQGNPAAFPYGYVMWFLFWPIIGLFKVLDVPIVLGHGLTILAIDFALLLMFFKIFPKKTKPILKAYWLSPIIIFASYFLGHNDLVPICLLMASIYFTKRLRFMWAGILCIASASAKLSMVSAIPFIFIYLIKNKSFLKFVPFFTRGVILGILLFLVPFAFSSEGIKMLFDNPEVDKIYQLQFSFTSGIHIYWVPLIYFLFLYLVWRIRRPNFELFYITLGITFFIIVLMTPASPGWYIWAVPLLTMYQIYGRDEVAKLMSWAFSILYILRVLLSSDYFDDRSISLLHTAMTGMGVILAIRIWRETVKKNDYFRLSQRPFVIGIAGDSGSGKSTLVDALKELFGPLSVTGLLGDNYHLWDRQRAMWQVMTHLNPKANDLECFAEDLASLASGKSIYSRHYGHDKGKMSRPLKVKSNDIIIAEGLHALYLPIMRCYYDLKIYLNIDETLRTYFKLQRDVYKRNQSKEKILSQLSKRREDSEKFIRPQIGHADLILSLMPIHRPEDARYQLKSVSRIGLNELSLVRALIGICGLRVDMISSHDATVTTLIIEGDCMGEDIALAAETVCPKVLNFLDIRPVWRTGVTGVMQLSVLSHINQILTGRVLS